MTNPSLSGRGHKVKDMPRAFDHVGSRPITRRATPAVIDIGSNSIRLVLYRLEGRAIWTVFNEKVLAGLGLRPAHDRPAIAPGREGGARRPAAVQGGAGLRASGQIVRRRDGRGARGRGRFRLRRRCEADTGLSVRVLSGGEEARYSALGVAAGIQAATRRGGRSRRLQPGVGLHGPWTPGRGRDPGAWAVRPERRRRRSIRNRLRQEASRRISAEVASRFATDTLYAIGGAWRNLALLHMRLSDYPLQIVQQYEISAKEALQASRFIASQSKGSLERSKASPRNGLVAAPTPRWCWRC